MPADYSIIEYNSNHQIVFIRDLNMGGMSVTNDAEQVYGRVRTTFGAVRVVYQDSNGDWDEIKQVAGSSPGDWNIVFEPWQGLFMDVLKRGL